MTPRYSAVPYYNAKMGFTSFGWKFVEFLSIVEPLDMADYIGKYGRVSYRRMKHVPVPPPTAREVADRMLAFIGDDRKDSVEGSALGVPDSSETRLGITYLVNNDIIEIREE